MSIQGATVMNPESYAGGRLDADQWGALAKLAKSPRRKLIISVSTSKVSIVGYLADDLVSAGVAETILNGQAIAPTPYGLELISTYGLDGLSAEV